MRKVIIFFLFASIVFFMNPYGFWGDAAIILWGWYTLQLIFKSSDCIAFRELTLFLFAVNFLFAPVLSYYGTEGPTSYRMKLTPSEYFSMAIPAMLCLQAGIYFIRTSVFSVNLTLVKIQTILNTAILKQWLFWGIGLSLISSHAPGELAFLFYLLSGIRYIAAFGLFVVDRKKYIWYILAVFFLEISKAVAQAMFHDCLMWLIFFGLFLIYYLRLKLWHKAILGTIGFFLFLTLQVAKNDYRKLTWYGSGEASISTLTKVAEKNVNAGLFKDDNVSSAVSRVNQAWIFASTASRMNRTLDYQGLHLVGIYLEAALLPRFLAPNKLTAGNREIFNKFSGHRISSGTAMGLGIFADGYIAYGFYGVLIFAFAFGLIFSIVFKITESWARISPFFIFFVFPILNYAVRPDCETPTVIGHILKGLIVFGIMMTIYRKYFARKLFLLRKQEEVSNNAGTSNQILSHQ